MLKELNPGARRLALSAKHQLYINQFFHLNRFFNICHMKMNWRSVLWPIVWLWVLKSRLRKYLFARGTWKSVAFEFPVIVVHDFMSTNTLKSLSEDLNIAIEKRYQSFVMMQPRTYEGTEDTKNKSHHYAIPIKGEQRTYTYRHLVLAMSELYAAQDSELMVLMHHDFVCEVRPSLSVLAVDMNCPLWEEKRYPVGNRTHSVSDMMCADIYIVSNVGDEEALKAIKEHLGSSLDKVYVLDFEKKLDISDREIRIIQDHDNFGRILGEHVDAHILKDQA